MNHKNLSLICQRLLKMRPNVKMKSKLEKMKI